MGFTLTGLSDYTNQLSTELISRSYFENRTAQYFQVQSGIKSAEAIQLLALTAVPQLDSACSFNASGNTTLTQRVITVGAIKYQDTLCPKALRAKWTQIMQRAGSNADSEEVPFEAQIAENLLMLIKEHIEVLDWQGDTGSANEYLNKYDGLIEIIDTAGTAITGNTSGTTSGTGITGGSSGNAFDLVYDMVKAMPAKLKTQPNKVLFVGTDTFDKYVETVIKKNYFHIDESSYANYEVIIPGSQVRMIGVHGLDATNRMFLGRQENFFLGIDLNNEEEEFKMWYSMDDDIVRYSVKFKRGVQVAYPAEIVQFELA